MVAGQHDDGVVEALSGPQDVEQPPHVLVEIRDGAVVRPSRRADVVGGNVGPLHGTDLAKSYLVGLESNVSYGEFRQWDLDIFVEVPEALRDHKGVVRVSERHDETERPVVAQANVVEQRPLCGVGNLIIEVELVGSKAGSSVVHREHVVVPGGALVWAVPSGRPPIVGGIDVRRQTFFETVQLVGTAEVHLPRKDRAIPGVAEIVGEGRDIRRELGSVVVGSRARGQQARHERRTCRRAQRACRVRRVEHDTSAG